MVSCWTTLIIIRNLMKNNIETLDFCYFPIKQKLWDIKVRPSFSSLISSVSRRAVCCVMCGEVWKGINSHMDSKLRQKMCTVHIFLRGSLVAAREQQRSSRYVCARIHLLDGGGKFERGQAVQLLASSVWRQRHEIVLPHPPGSTIHGHVPNSLTVTINR
jgi:hypothetical protein